MRHLGDHVSTLVRHGLSLLLLCGTVSGSLFTLSSGKLTLPAAQEMLLSVGGVTLALELGCFFCAVMLGELKRRARTAHTPRIRADYSRQGLQLTRWLVLLVGTSAVANFFFRLQTLHSLWLAVFFALATSILLVCFTIVLQPLGVDYHAKARISMQAAIVGMVQEAGATVNRTMRDLSTNKPVTPERLQMLSVALSILSAYAPKDEQAALQFATAGYTGQTVVDADDTVYWSCVDLMQLYGVSRRTAQSWIGSAPGKRRAGRNGASEAPRSAIELAHGLPKALVSVEADQAPRASRSAAGRSIAQSRAIFVQTSADLGQKRADLTQDPAAFV